MVPTPIIFKFMNNTKRLAVDVGGTFIDFVSLDQSTGKITVEKVRSAGQLENQFFEGLSNLNLDIKDIEMIVHGSTLVINTIIQEDGAKVGLITTQGFRDVLELGRGSREEIYNLFFKPPKSIIPRYLRFEVAERLDANGDVITPLDETMAKKVVLALKEQEVESIAVCFLHAYVNPIHEKRMANIANDVFPDAKISISSDIAREWREFERTNTTALNAYAQPRMENYLSQLDKQLNNNGYKGALTIMKSSGGITTSDVAQKKPIMTIQSGPAGGVIGAQRLADILKIKHMVVADVGGTSFDVSLIYDGRYLESTSSKLHRRPILQPTIDIVSIGAGGGSIAWIDQEAGLRVGPQSAEADPGPVCFSMGGEEPTVTDAQLVLGYLNPKTYLGKRMHLDLDAAREAIKVKIAEKLHLSTEEAAAGIIQIAATNMAYAVRQITVERGHDPREFSLTCIGGGGGLFAGEILKELQMKQVILPQNPAVFSAWGLLNADYREDVTKPFLISRKDVTPKALKIEFETLENEVRKWFSSENIDFNKMTIERFAEMRYLGQEHTLKIPINKEDFLDPDLIKLRDRFDIHYKKAYSHALPNHDIEFVILRLAAIGAIDKPDLSKINPSKNNGILKSSEERQVYMSNQKQLFSCKVFQRDELSSGMEIIGPAFIEEWNSTILIHSKQRAEVDDLGNLFIKVKT